MSMLFGVTDENTRPIKTMDVAQKPTKGKSLRRSFKPSKSYVVPPRFLQNTSKHIDSAPKGHNSFSDETSFLKEPQNKPELKEPPMHRFQEEPILPPKASVKEEVSSLLEYFGRLPINRVLPNYHHMYDKELILSKYGYFSLTECIEDIPELHMESIDNVTYVIYNSNPYEIFIEDDESQHTSWPVTSFRTAHKYNDNAEHRTGTFIPNVLIKKMIKNIPDGAVYPCFKFSTPVFPKLEYFPVQISCVADPSDLYVQIQWTGYAEELLKKSDLIQTFYNGIESEHYKMKAIHITIGASCIAQWPADNHWYRAEITSISSSNTVTVFYVDYGFQDTIYTNLLRYICGEFAGLPAQAIKCRLSLIKPAENAETWNTESRAVIQSFCRDASLMAKVEKVGADGVYSIVLYNINGKEDMFISEVLVQKGIAVYENQTAHAAAIASPTASNLPVPLELPVRFGLNALQIRQAKYHLQMISTVAPSLATNEYYINLVNAVNSFVPVSSTGDESCERMPSLLSDVSSKDMKQKLVTSSATASATVESCVAEPKESKHTTTPSTLVHSPDDLHDDENDNEIFMDDEDELFELFCRRVLLSPKLRHVKRVCLDKDYKVHVILCEKLPYVSSGDVSHLIWSNKDDHHLLRELQHTDFVLPSLELSKDDHENLFKELERYDVKGIHKECACKSSILLFPLEVVIEILNIFCQSKSVIFRQKLTEEMTNFDPNDPIWMRDPIQESLETGKEFSVELSECLSAMKE